MTDEQVEFEIEKLNNSEYVKLAKKEQRLKYKRRQHLYQLRWLEKRGKQLANNGVSEERLEEMYATDE